MYVTSNTFFVYGNGYLLCFKNKANIFPTAYHFTRCEDFFCFFIFYFYYFFFESVPMNIVHYFYPVFILRHVHVRHFQYVLCLWERVLTVF